MDAKKREEFFQQQSVTTKSADGSDMGLFGFGNFGNSQASSNMQFNKTTTPPQVSAQQMFDYGPMAPSGNNYMQPPHQQMYE